MKPCSFQWIFFLVLFVCPLSLRAQQDTLYYVSYTHKITARLYVSRKFTSLKMQGTESGYKINYRPNTTWNLGIGATYKWATLNLAYGFGFLNPDLGQGKTKYLDAQFHNYGRRYILDIFGQFYKGFYLAPNEHAGLPDEYYVRPDMRVNLLGTSLQYVFNHKRFSYRSSYLQNEWQKKSAGTFLLGIEGYAGTIKTDSTIIPTILDSATASKNITSYRFFELGPNGGYAYTFVYKKHFFATASGAVSLTFGSSAVTTNDGIDHNPGFIPNTIFRLAGGYNSERWAVSIIYINSAVRMNNTENEKRMTINTSNVRVNIVHRFNVTQKVKKYLKPIDAIPIPEM